MLLVREAVLASATQHKQNTQQQCKASGGGTGFNLGRSSRRKG